ncbi:MAG: hypothetical protein IJ746_00980 [Ruminococcus sp.]|nr:hypothetical protein [Ruminococcus sp.]
MKKKDKRTRELLEKCAESYRPDAPDRREDLTSGVCSATESTGIVPGGGDLSEEEFRELQGF